MHTPDVSRGRQILSRFLTLAEERLAYLTLLYETDRWQRYFTQTQLLDNVRDAKKAVAAWTLLVSTEALPNNQPVDLSWLDSPRALPPRRLLMLDVEMPDLSSRSTEQPLAPERISSDLLPPIFEPITIAAQAVAGSPALQPTAELPQLPPWQNALDFALMEQRYSLLRKAG